MDDRLVTSTARADGGLPDKVFASPGGRMFHTNRGCSWFWTGLDTAADARGSSASEIYLNTPR